MKQLSPAPRRQLYRQLNWPAQSSFQAPSFPPQEAQVRQAWSSTWRRRQPPADGCGTAISPGATIDDGSLTYLLHPAGLRPRPHIPTPAVRLRLRRPKEPRAQFTLYPQQAAPSKRRSPAPPDSPRSARQARTWWAPGSQQLDVLVTQDRRHPQLRAWPGQSRREVPATVSMAAPVLTATPGLEEVPSVGPVTDPPTNSGCGTAIPPGTKSTMAPQDTSAHGA